jgi:hypothetical protein
LQIRIDLIVKKMARGHQKELSRQRSEKNAASNKPTTQKGTAGKKNFSFTQNISFLLNDLLSSCWINLSMYCL